MATYKGQDGVFQAITSGGTLASVSQLRRFETVAKVPPLVMA